MSKRKCKHCIQQLATFCKNFETSFSETFTISLLEVKKDELDRRWLKVVESYDNYIEDDDKIKEEEELQDEVSIKYEEISEKYQTVKAIILEAIKSISNKSSQDVTRHSALKLPAIQIQNFEGGFNKWPAFRDMFMAAIGKEPSIAPAHKLYYLLGNTSGEAYHMIKDYDMVDANFDIAWNALKNRYENKRILINNQIDKIKAIRTPPSENLKFLRIFQNSVNDCLSVVESFNINIPNNDPFLMNLCAAKLPEDTSRAWENALVDHKELPSWQHLSDFLSGRIETLETFANLRKPVGKEYSDYKSQVFYSHSETTRSDFNCKKCKKNHPLKECGYFKSLSVKDRIKFVYSNKYCANCFSTRHFKSNCQSKNSCIKCNKRHHTMLHLETDDRTRRTPAPMGPSHPCRQDDERPSGSGIQNKQSLSNSQSYTSNTNQTESVQVNLSQHNGTTILPTALVNVEHLGEEFTIRAMIDTGSTKSFILKRVQQRLLLPLEKYYSEISGFGETVVGNSKGRCLVTVKSRISDFSIKIQAIVVPTLAHFMPLRPISVELLPEIKDLKLADPYFYKPAAIDMIIGSDYLPFINLKGVKMNIGNCLEARESKFGWYLMGPEPVNEVRLFHTIVSPSNDQVLHEQLKKFWEIEEAEKSYVESENDINCENYYQRTTSRNCDGRYVVRLPFKENFSNEIFLGPSRNMALAQYLRMEKTLEKSPDLKAEYTKVLQEYIDLDHMEQVVHFEPKVEKQSSFFLPHHAVIKPESKTTKVRVVFNASKKTGSGFSLNDVLHQGPTLQTDLMQLVLRWRNYKFVFTGDIEKMYRQILVHEADRPYQQILFRNELDGYVNSFQLKTVTFGVNCAPYLAIRTLLQLSDDCKNIYPKASAILKNEVYVDDILSGGHTVEEAKLKQSELRIALKSAGFPLKKMTANNQILLENLPREDLLDEDFLKFDDSSTIKTLGIRWNALSDFFYYVVEPIEITPATTKRRILSVIARLFDPLGWLGPVVIVAKTLMQDLWEEKSDWDEEVPQSILSKWSSFLTNLPFISNIKIPRWVNFSPHNRIQIHGFCDASERAYCGCIYIRTESPEGLINSHLLVAKTKVAPIKRITIPKLELCGALLLVKLIRNLITNCQFNYELFLWTDSAIVLGWLQKQPNTLKTFVANRVTQIINIASTKHWKHVKTEENPADMGTRGCSPQELVDNELWWHGPSWLKFHVSLWPIPRIFDPTDLETKKPISFHTDV